jgi:hypothetical protein
VAPQGGFKHHWRATILERRPLILPQRRYVYPREADEVERGALELLVTPGSPVTSQLRAGGFPAGSAAHSSQPFEPFLATCALGFADPLAPTGVWSCPQPTQLCAVAGGYAYLIDTSCPERFEQIAYRPVLAVHAVCDRRLLLFIGSNAILAYDAGGRAWESPRLSDEGVSVTSIEDGLLRGRGWQLATDQETPFTLDLETGLITGLASL